MKRVFVCVVCAVLVGCGASDDGPDPRAEAAARAVTTAAGEVNGLEISRVSCTRDGGSQTYSCRARVTTPGETATLAATWDDVDCEPVECVANTDNAKLANGDRLVKPASTSATSDAAAEDEPVDDSGAETQRTFTKLDNLAIKIDDALGDAADAVVGDAEPSPVAARLRSLYRQVRKIGDEQLLEDDDRFVIPSNLVAGAAFNGRAALLDGNPPVVVKQRREIAEARRQLADAVVE